MANTFFKFKQFTIEQDRCAMKVSTDACILGAWTPVDNGIKNVLDIGAGTGLLSLMLAQVSDTITVDAVELDTDAAEQAAENFNRSNWADRLNLVNTDIQTYAGKTYDLIITNPPFFNNSLLGEDAKRNTARHTNELSFHSLITSINRLLNFDGYVSVLLPLTEFAQVKALAKEQGLILYRELIIHPRIGKDANRVVGLFRKGVDMQNLSETLFIKELDNSDTEQFKELLAPYYMYI